MKENKRDREQKTKTKGTWAKVQGPPYGDLDQNRPIGEKVKEP